MAQKAETDHNVDDQLVIALKGLQDAQREVVLNLEYKISQKK